MKKAYIMPLAEVVKTETKEQICQSSVLFSEETVGAGHVGVLGNDEFENVFEDLW